MSNFEREDYGDNFEWEDYGDNFEDWNKNSSNRATSPFTEEGHGLYLESPLGSGNRYFIPAMPVLSDRVIVTQRMRYSKGVEEVFNFDFQTPDGYRFHSPSLRIERTGKLLKAVPIICGVSPTQIRMAMFIVVKALK